MKKLLPILLFTCQLAYAQNYQCLQSGVKRYFVNGNGYLRAMHIDSVKVTGDTVVYYPFHTPRGAYNDTSAFALDTNGGSWLGKRVLQKVDGTFIFDSYWGDSVILKTQAAPGDSWVFYRDTSRLYYQATMLGVDTLTILGAIDSVKTLLITARNDSGIVASDPVDSFTILLSKNHGFVQVFDLYTFPYHRPDTVYYSGQDFFLDRSTCTYSDVNSWSITVPAAVNALFRLTDFIIPNDQQLHNWNVGDVFEGVHSVQMYLAGGYIKYIVDTVASKAVSGHAVTYTLNGVYFECPNEGSGYYCPTYFDYCKLVMNAGVRTYYDTVYPIADTGFLPETSLNPANYIFYFPLDTSFCTQSPAYVLTYASIPPRDEGPAPVNYKLGIGVTDTRDFDDNCIISFFDRMVYADRNGTECGIFYPVHLDPVAKQPPVIRLYPNPAATVLYIASTAPLTSVIVTSVFGQQVLRAYTNGNELELDVSGLLPGIYAIRINGSEIRKLAKE